MWQADRKRPKIRPIQEPECDRLRKEMMGKDDLL